MWLIDIFKKKPKEDAADSMIHDLFPGNLSFNKWILSDGGKAPINQFKNVVRIHLNAIALIKKSTLDSSNSFVVTFDNKEIYDWYPVKMYLQTLQKEFHNRHGQMDKTDVAMALEAIRACVFDFGNMNSKYYNRLLISCVIRNEELSDKMFLDAYRRDKLVK